MPLSAPDVQRVRQRETEWVRMEGWAGGRDLETAGECDEAWRKKTVNEAFLEAQRDYPPQKNLWAFFKPNGPTRKTESNLEEFVSERKGRRQ